MTSALTTQKNWLLISHAFNMDGRAASLTITDKIPYLLDAGIKPIVFSAITGMKDTRFPHQQFLAWGPAAFRFDFRHWIANKYGRGFTYKVLTRTVSVLLAPLIAIEKLFLGYSSQWSWALPAFIRGYWLIKTGKVDVVYSIGSAWSAHLAGVWLKRATGIKLISEVHDPLVIRKDPDDQGFEKPKNRDARFRHYLESQLCKHSNYVWWFTEGALHYAKVRNPNLNTPGNATGFVVMPFLPGDSLLFVAGAIAAVGGLDLWMLMALLTFAAVLGDALNYSIGRYVGNRVFSWENSRWFNRNAFDKAHAFYEKYGPVTIVLGRFMPFIRTFAPFVAGVGSMKYPAIAIASAAAGRSASANTTTGALPPSSR